MRKIILFLFFVMFIGCACAFQSPSNVLYYSRDIPSNTVLQNSLYSTAILLRMDSNNIPEISCSGVFIEPHVILTAAHCVSTETVVQTPFGTIVTPSDVNPIGQHHYIVTYSDWLRVSLNNRIRFEVTAYDREKDLAIMMLDDENIQTIYGNHVAHFAQDRSPIGMQLFAIGHPVGIPFNVTSGYVSSRVALEEGTYRLYSNVPVFYGNSGGPILNMDGEIVGICSTIVRTPHLNRAVHVRTIRQFMHEYQHGNV